MYGKSGIWALALSADRSWERFPRTIIPLYTFPSHLSTPVSLVTVPHMLITLYKSNSTTLHPDYLLPCFFLICPVCAMFASATVHVTNSKKQRR